MEISMSDVAANDELLPLDNVKAFLSLYESTLTTEQTALLNSMIVSARQICEEYCMRSFVEKTFTIFFETSELDDGKITLPFYPHVSIASVTRFYRDGTNDDINRNTGYYRTGEQEFTLDFVISNATFTETEPVGYKVVYVAGYGSNTQTLPTPLKEAMLKLIADWWGKRDDYQPMLDMRTKRILDKYKSNDWV